MTGRLLSLQVLASERATLLRRTLPEVHLLEQAVLHLPHMTNHAALTPFSTPHASSMSALSAYTVRLVWPLALSPVRLSVPVSSEKCPECRSERLHLKCTSL